MMSYVICLPFCTFFCLVNVHSLDKKINMTLYLLHILAVFPKQQAFVVMKILKSLCGKVILLSCLRASLADPEIYCFSSFTLILALLRIFFVINFSNIKRFEDKYLKRKMLTFQQIFCRYSFIFTRSMGSLWLTDVQTQTGVQAGTLCQSMKNRFDSLPFSLFLWCSA